MPKFDGSPGELTFQSAGPREQIYFDPARTRAGIVTCGGLCPGLNNVIRSIVLELHHHYGVPEIFGFRYGYSGLNPAFGHQPLLLTPSVVSDIHQQGGTILGTSRGAQDARVIVDYLEELRINILFCVGGDGTQRGAHKIYEESARRGYPLSIVGVPKTIDNDIQYVWRTFGYFTALEQSRLVIDSAHNEARSVYNGIGLVKLMGRDAGFIAAGATLASQEVNFTLIPEVPFHLHGPGGFLECLKERIGQRHHAVIVVAEGAGQELFASLPAEFDASGNRKQHDIGTYLRDEILAWFARERIPVSVKYLDPSYFIRSRPANTDDMLLCDQLARNAAHAAMAGFTDVLIGLWYNLYIHVPIPMATSGKKLVTPESDLWNSVLAATGQPRRMC